MRQIAQETGKFAFELPFFWQRKAPLKILKFEFIEYKNVQHEVHQEVITYTDTTQQIEYSLNKNRGLIVLTIHLGCFEVLAQMYAQYVNVTALYKPPRQKELYTRVNWYFARPSAL
ncbi:hypothetical protein ACTFIZ_007517 [Dictyostelium cf. discoideum]